MFELNRKSPINKGKISKIIIEPEKNNADIDYEIGYLDEDGDFNSLGVDHFHIEDREEQKDKNGKVTETAKTDYTEFELAFEKAKKPLKLAEDILIAKSIIKIKEAK